MINRDVAYTQSTRNVSDDMKTSTPPPSDIIITDLYQGDEKIYARAFDGIFKRLRMLGGWLLLSFYFGMPWISWGERQAVWFDLPRREFHIFHVTFWPQDFVLLGALLIIAAFTLFFVTNFAGRIWCGYTCPQSVWTWIFMWAERITEGDRNKRMKLDQRSWDVDKLLRKTAKHLLWLLIALATALTFVGYFTPIKQLLVDFIHLNLVPWAAFWVFFFTLATYGNAGWLREQVCIYMCPYARFQSVMFDKDTLIVSYDPRRGEKRGARKKEVDPKTVGLGDCIDCHVCVQVCPTGIDIRDGLQYKCIGCAACIDACDSIMEKMNYPKGLISYTTEHNLQGNQTHYLRPRLIGYGTVLFIMISAFVYALNHRIPVGFDAIRDRYQLFRETMNGTITNVYNLQISNKDQKAHTYRITVEGIEGAHIIGKNEVTVASGEVFANPIDVEVTPTAMNGQSNVEIKFTLVSTDQPNITKSIKSRFVGPKENKKPW